MLFNSIQSKIILLLGLICIILTLIKYFSLKLIIQNNPKFLRVIKLT